MASVALRQPVMSLEEFLAWEEQQEDRWEFDGFQPVAMVGTAAHNLIAGAMVEFTLRQRVKSLCRVFHEGMRLRLAHTIRHPT